MRLLVWYIVAAALAVAITSVWSVLHKINDKDIYDPYQDD